MPLFYLTNQVQDVLEVKLAIKYVWKKSYSLFVITITFFQFIHYILLPLFAYPHTVPLYNHPLNKPMRKWQRKCVRDQFLSVSHWHDLVTPLLSSVLPVNRERTHSGSGGAL